MAKYHSQYNQDRFLDKVVFNGKKKGFFIDIGAHDGVSLSNSLFFENKREWNGICIEPNPNVFSKLEKNRKSINLNICIGKGNSVIKFTRIKGYAEMLSGVTDTYAPEHLKRIEKEVKKYGGSVDIIDVEMKRLENLEGIKNQIIDFISIDTEGNELDIVKSIDFSNSTILCLVIENNYNDDQIKKLLSNYGYRQIAKLRRDDVFIHNQYSKPSFRLRLMIWRIKIFLKKGVSKFLKHGYEL